MSVLVAASTNFQSVIKKDNFNQIFLLHLRHRGYYMPARGYEFYLRVFNSISSWTLEDKIHIHKRACNIVYYINILLTMFLTTFRRFPTSFRRFPNIFQNCSAGLTNVSEVPMMFRSYTTSEYFLSDYVAIAMAILRLVTTCYFHVWRYHVILTCEDIMFTRESSPCISLVFT